jgi:Tfp pilus assembly protein PilO
MISLPKLSYRYYLSQIPLPVRKTSQKWGPTVGALLLVAFFIIFAIKPTVVTIVELLAEIKGREELNQQLEEKIAQIITAQTLYNQVYDRLYLLDQALPGNPDFAYFSQSLEGNRLKADLALSTLNYSSIVLTQKKTVRTTESEKSQEVSFITDLDGYYPNLKTFLENIFNQRRIIYLSNLEISPNKAALLEDQILPLVITIDGETFYLGK